ncbi:UrcA family protein [Maricaulaceae bacterium NA33B04]|nr:UrcA family protein [Maricaulaceae bacterium NA33B04]
MKKTLSALIATAAITLGAGTAPALATDSETFVFRVDAAALQTPADVDAAYQRLSAEAERYCRTLDLVVASDRASCRLDVVTNVVAAVGDDRLSAAHRAATSELRLASID